MSERRTKVVWITGAGGALGTHVSTAFQDAGWQLALAGYSSTMNERLADVQRAAFVHQVDLTSETAAQVGAAEVLKRFGRIDALVNLVGGFAMSSAGQSTNDELERMLALNLGAAFNAIRAVLPSMIERGTGSILGVGAAPGLSGAPGLGTYAASKGALIAYMRSLRKELAPIGIRVSIVHPMSAFDTPRNRADMPNADPSQWIDPAELAATIVFLAERSARGAIDEVRVFGPG